MASGTRVLHLRQMESDSQLSDSLDARHERHSALSILMDAFVEARLDGLPEDSMTQAAIFVAFQKLVACYGEDAVAIFAERLPERIRQGEFSVVRRQ